jgi:hypothetical protein
LWVGDRRLGGLTLGGDVFLVVGGIVGHGGVKGALEVCSMKDKKYIE